MPLRLSPEIELPTSAATSTFAILGMRGYGKSYGAGVLAEELHGAGVQTIIVDPVGIWWGLRVSADGKGRGLPIPVFGGMHGDLPIEAAAGEVIAQLLIDRRSSAVLDVSEFSDGQQHRFVCDLCRALFALKRRRPGPLHIMFDEGHEFLPQVVDAAAAPMVGATKKLWKVGRNYGIGGTIISPRAAEVNKGALNLTEHLITSRIKAPNDMKAIASWASSSDADDAVIAQIRTQPKGTLTFWSDDGAVTSRFRRKLTFDSSRTPDQLEDQVVAELLPIDVVEIRAAMAATIETVKRNDPVALRAEIDRLRGLMGASATPAADRDMLVSLKRERDTMRIERDRYRQTFDEFSRRYGEFWRTIKAALDATETMPALPDVQTVRGARNTLTLEDIPAQPEPPFISKDIRRAVADLKANNTDPPKFPIAPNSVLGKHLGLERTPRPEGWTMEEDELYEKFKQRLIREAPGLLKVIAKQPELVVEFEREILQIDGKSLAGRVARLVAQGFFDAAQSNAAASKEINRTGAQAHPGNVHKEITKLVAMGILHRADGKCFIVAPGAKVQVKEA